MSDARLRELERRFRETGSVEDETAWLAARLRRGELEQSRLEVARLCGHPAARGVEMTASATSREVIESLRISRSTLNGWSKQGMPREKVGRTWCYDVAACFDWLGEHSDQHRMGPLQLLVRFGCLVHPEFGVRAAHAAADHALRVSEGSAEDKARLREGPLTDLLSLIEEPSWTASEEAFDRAGDLVGAIPGKLGSLVMPLGNLIGGIQERDDLPQCDSSWYAIEAIQRLLKEIDDRMSYEEQVAELEELTRAVTTALVGWSLGKAP